jgi:hypothetical protein
MKPNTSIQLKAAFLFIVFALNTAVGFACSMGLEMGYNNKHHQEETIQKNPSHSQGHSADVKVSHHHEAASRSNHHEKGVVSHHGDDPADNHHAEVAVINHHEKKTTEQDDCCNKNAVVLQQVDKSLNHASNFLVKVPVFVAFLSAFLGLELAPAETLAASSKYLILQYYPPPDIRIAIQSFQI